MIEGDGGNAPEAGLRIESVPDLLKRLTTLASDGKERWFRGHRETHWLLSPSVFRTTKIADSEKAMLARFRHEAAVTGVPFGFDEWGWIAYAQHFSLPTRLLDWSKSPLVALYFATEPPDPNGAGEAAEKDGEFFVLKPGGLNRDAGDASGDPKLLVASDDDLKPYLPSGASGEKTPRAVVAPALFDRIRFQAGTFTVEQRPRPQTPQPLRDSKHVQTFVIPARAKPSIRTELEALDVNEANVYRDLDRVSRRIKKNVEVS